MFHDIPKAMIDRMRQLELADAADRDRELMDKIGAALDKLTDNES